MILIAISVLALAAWAYLAAVRLPVLRPLERLAETVMGMGLLYIAPPALALSYGFHHDDVAAYAGWAAWLLMALTDRPTLALYGQTFVMAFLLPLAAALYTAMTVSSALRHWRGRGGAWKGLTYPA